ncbi:MAG TPA: hypothetical protein ENK31_02765 [Nannocystis exedens]|nr:hypothetical protein [Nannocystis exedens]
MGVVAVAVAVELAVSVAELAVSVALDVEAVPSSPQAARKREGRSIEVMGRRICANYHVLSIAF